MMAENLAVAPLRTAARVWIVLVNWNGWRDTVECLESVFRLREVEFGVIVCDNDSTDGSVEAIAAWAAGAQAYQAKAGPLSHLSDPPLSKPLQCEVLDAGQLPDMTSPAPLYVLRTGANLGFAGGNNVGIRCALTDPACAYVWLLNNDTVVDPAALAHMVRRAGEEPDAGITGSVNCFYADPQVVQALGGGTFSCARVSGRLYGNCQRRDAIPSSQWDEARNRLMWVSGASMLVSRRFLETVGEMEESYFLYFEELDWALRSRSRFRNVLAEQALVYHKGGSSTGEQRDSSFAAYTQCRSRFKLYRKHLPLLLPACYARTVWEMLIALLKGRQLKLSASWKATREDFLRR